MSNPRHSDRASGLWGTLKRVARSSKDPLVGGLPRQMTSDRSSGIQCMEHAMADARFSDVLYTGEATTARFSNHQTPNVSNRAGSVISKSLDLRMVAWFLFYLNQETVVHTALNTPCDNNESRSLLVRTHRHSEAPWSLNSSSPIRQRRIRFLKRLLFVRY
jgi:hypothetical protein